MFAAVQCTRSLMFGARYDSVSSSKLYLVSLMFPAVHVHCTWSLMFGAGFGCVSSSTTYLVIGWDLAVFAAVHYTWSLMFGTRFNCVCISTLYLVIDVWDEV